ncbi:MAG: hypothetical protein OXS50_01200, partial [Gammaproteobacteria bacterium]|nr:hypothetical protein [Gammaproteobacteria bacterium]
VRRRQPLAADGSAAADPGDRTLSTTLLICMQLRIRIYDESMQKQRVTVTMDEDQIFTSDADNIAALAAASNRRIDIVPV